MSELQIDSIEEPFASDHSLAEQALRLLFRAEFVSCLPEVAPVVLNYDAIAAVGRCMQQAELPTMRWIALLSPDVEITVSRWHDTIAAMNDQLEMSPMPAGEWDPAIETLGEDLLASLLGVSVSSVRRYRAGGRATPQDVAERLHFVALLLADLAGSYNDFGMRRWFTRPRATLSGKRPAELLGASFDPEAKSAAELQRLAASLTGAGAA